MTFRRIALAASCGIAAAVPLGAQCSDGSPPPCRAMAVASAVSRRADPAMDPKTWIVVPFDNLNNNADVDWLRTGAVNLLYLGMSRWTDIRVIDDERVADYMRDVPGAVAEKSLTASQAVAIAKRAGAAQVVMGDVLKLGNRITVNAKIYDVKSGVRQRSVREETNSADSLMVVFARLSQKVLNVPLPAGASAGATVTSSIAAYQEYAQGMAALNLFDLPRGEAHLKRALELDSTFALAHAKLSVLLGWIAPGTPQGRQHAEAASRLAGSLPPREQALVKASVAFARNDYVTACAGFRDLIKHDSTDTDAWYGLGDCLFHDNAMEPTNGDSTKPRWRASRNESIRAFRTVLALDPTYHLAYQHVADMYAAQVLGGQWCTGGRCTRYVAVIRPSADSFLLTPVAVPQDTATLRAHMEDYVRRGSRRAMLASGRNLAEQWVAANPTEGRARMVYAGLLLSSGDLVGADTNLRKAVLTDSANAGTLAMLLKMELHVKLGRIDAAVRLYDSVRTHPIPLPGPQGNNTGGAVTLAAPLFGHASEFDSLMNVGLRQTRASPALDHFAHASVRALMGAPPDDLAALARAYFDEASVASKAGATVAVGARLSFTLRTPLDQWPALDTTRTELTVAPAIAVLRRDTVALRRAAKQLDSLSTLLTNAILPDTGITLIAAEAYLALNDSLRALQMSRRWLDSVVTYTQVINPNGGGFPYQALVPRAMRLRAELAAALGYKDEARLWCDRFLALWVKADPEFAPVVAGVRKVRAGVSP